MHMIKVTDLFLVLLCCELCSTIKVPVSWDESANSEVNNAPRREIPVEIIEPQNIHLPRPPNYRKTPAEYFEYTAQKPKFAADIAAFHGVQNPQEHYKAYPVKPYTGKQKPALGNHHMLDDNKTIYKPFQNYVQQNTELNSFVEPTSSNYEVFHPYQSEEPALKEIYKDPVLTKIRNDLLDSKNRLQAYEQQAGEPNVDKEEHLESPETTDSKLFPHKNVPSRYEIHRPERRPIYYRRPPYDSNRDQVLNKRLKHPWNQNAKIRPIHYRPLHSHIHNLRQQHSIKYDDERNEYPQVPVSGNFAEPEDGYDIYEKGKQKYVQLRNNLDESVNNIIQKNRPPTFQKLELQTHEPEDDEEKEEFVPVKNYAQVRKTETFKHLPKKAALDDAETYEEILNAPRLREAVKSTKAQTVYSEEGYEDTAYDHAGEQKYASDHEGHGGFLKEHENSGGLYKIPTVSGKYKDGRGSEYKDSTEHGEKWKNNNKDDEEETDAEEFSEHEHEESINADIHNDKIPKAKNRNKRQGLSYIDVDSSDIEDDDDDASESDNSDESYSDSDSLDISDTEHEVDKREVNFKVPEINLNSTLSIKSDPPKPEKQIAKPQNDNIKEKYPYYFKKIKGIHRDSPLRYAENLKFMPRKSSGGTEFYDSRSQIQCFEVDDEVDPIPEKLKNGEDPTDDDDEDGEDNKNKGKKNFDTVKKQPRLKGLGDKIDCFKAKYFGENPLDSPFFKEEIIANPELLIKPKLSTYQLKNIKGEIAQESKLNNVIDLSDQSKDTTKTNIFILLDKLRNEQHNSTLENLTNQVKKDSLYKPQISSNNDTQQANVYTDILKNIKNNTRSPEEDTEISTSLLDSNKENVNTTYHFFQNKEEVTMLPPIIRKKRATPFVYEPYKIIRDSQVQDSKKTTTTSNISPLIKQLQSSRVAERVSRSNKDDKSVSQRGNSRTYVDIGRKDRTIPARNGNSNADATFVDVSVDHRRGEPRYELRPTNHKSEYTPVENKRAMSLEAYKSHASTEKNKENTTQKPSRGRQRFRFSTTVKPYYNAVEFIPNSVDIQNAAASNAIKKTVVSAAPKTTTENQENTDEDTEEEDDGEDYDEEDDDEETVITTTTPKPSFRRRMRITTTTEKTPEHTTEKQLLKLVTRFRNYKPDENTETRIDSTERPENNKDNEDDIAVPKYREKKKKSHTSTLVTDTKKYGDDNGDDMRKEEVDAMIGIKHNMDDYIPMYEKEEDEKEHLYRSKKNKGTKNKQEDDDDEDEDSENDDDEDDDDDEEEDDGENDEDEDESEDSNDKKDDDKSEDADDTKNNENAEEEEEEEESNDPEPEVTTPEPTKRTLVRTTIAPPTTKATLVRSTSPTITSRSLPANKPIVTRKKIEIHKELPVNRSSPHITKFKQDIKEVEIIKEIPAVPKKKPQKNIEALNLYKDDDLAKDINNLGDVEVFRENLDLDKGPKHGGNYRQATKEDLRLLKPKLPKDPETSQSRNTKHIELDEERPKRLHGGNLKSVSDINRSVNSEKSAKLIELSEPIERGMHGGNLKYDNKRRGGGRKSEKLVELDDVHEEDSSDRSSRKESGYRSHNSRNDRLHGGNYKSAKLVAPTDDLDDIQVKSSTKNTRSSAAVLLNSFAQAIPILTTTPGYIVDPSKRMYYYVDT